VAEDGPRPPGIVAASSDPNDGDDPRRFSPMQGPIDARYVWDVEVMTDGLAAHRRHVTWSGHRYLNMLAGLLLILSIGGLVSMVLVLGMPPEKLESAAIVLLLGILVWGWLISGQRNNRFLRWQARKVFRSVPGGSESVEWSFGPDEIAMQTTKSASTLLWPVFIKVVEAPKGFLLYHNSQLFNWIPGHAFSSEGELRRFADLARARVPHYVVLGECRFPAKPEPLGLDEL
jgi:hypothetical protein